MNVKKVIRVKRQKFNGFVTSIFSTKIQYLKEKGWYESVKSLHSVDSKKLPIPWFSYPFLDFITTRFSKKMKVFEYGAGNSTIWWSNFAEEVVSCEHDKFWVEKLKPLPTNVKIFHKDLDSGYEQFIENYKNYFDVIVIDGRKRNECIKNSLNSLNKSGVIILDDSNRIAYEEGCNYLQSKGFKRLDFHGIGPIVTKGKSTSVFYRSENVLRI